MTARGVVRACGNLRDEVVPAFLLEHEMQMCWTPAVPSQQTEELADRSVMGDRIADGFDALEPEAAVLIRLHDASLARLLARGVLDVVVSRAIRLPYIHLDALHRISVPVFDGAESEQRLSLGVGAHVATVGQDRRVMSVKWTEN